MPTNFKLKSLVAGVVFTAAIASWGPTSHMTSVENVKQVISSVLPPVDRK